MNTWRTHRKTQPKNQQEVTPTKAYTQTNQKSLSTSQPGRPATLQHNWIADRAGGFVGLMVHTQLMSVCGVVG